MAALSMELLLMVLERGSGQDLALPTGFSALSGAAASVFQAGMGRENYLENPDSPTETTWRWVRMLPKAKQKEANEELSKTKQKTNKNSPTRVIHHQSCSSVKHEHFASLSHLLRPFFPQSDLEARLAHTGPIKIKPLEIQVTGAQAWSLGTRKSPSTCPQAVQGAEPLTQVTAHPHSDLAP